MEMWNIQLRKKNVTIGCRRHLGFSLSVPCPEFKAIPGLKMGPDKNEDICVGGLAVIEELQSLIPGPEPSHQKSLGNIRCLASRVFWIFPSQQILASVHSMHPEPGPVRGTRAWRVDRMGMRLILH